MAEKKQKLDEQLRGKLPPLQITAKLKKLFRSDAVYYIRVCEQRAAGKAKRMVFIVTKMGVWLANLEGKVLHILKYAEIVRVEYAPPKRKGGMYEVMVRAAADADSLSVYFGSDKMNEPKHFDADGLRAMHQVMATCKQFFMKEELPLEEVAHIAPAAVATAADAAGRTTSKIEDLKRGSLVKRDDVPALRPTPLPRPRPQPQPQPQPRPPVPRPPPLPETLFDQQHGAQQQPVSAAAAPPPPAQVGGPDAPEEGPARYYNVTYPRDNDPRRRAPPHEGSIAARARAHPSHQPRESWALFIARHEGRADYVREQRHAAGSQGVVRTGWPSAARPPERLHGIHSMDCRV
eukprot:TRINITY_DN3973_c0_g10_i1.p1 TRINITY_DN3973_c0_g10~~TRINITY_DN3973_c0_g10_i1.p1  ORF type:complete len:375 (+),score=110.08 TRINITY_DN3973_c0_g10_i1:84-1127(+)